MNKKENREIISKLIENEIKEPVDLIIKLKSAEEIHIKVQPQLSIEKRLEMVHEIYNFVCINSEEDDLSDVEPTIGSYMAGLLHYAQRYAVITYFTDLEIPSDNGRDVKLVNKLIMNTSLYEKVMEIVGDEAESIFQEAGELIKVYRDTIVGNYNFNSVAKKLTTFIESISEQFKTLNADEINELLAKFKNADIEEILGKIHTENEDKNKNVG